MLKNSKLKFRVFIWKMSFRAKKFCIEKTLCVAGIKKRKNNVTVALRSGHWDLSFLRRSHKMSFRCETFFAWEDIFHMNTRNFSLNFFDILKSHFWLNGCICTLEPKGISASYCTICSVCASFDL